MEASRINAIATPAPSVFASGRRFLGVLTLDTRFPRLPGDIGNPASFGVPTLTRVVRGARPQDAVQTAAGQRESGLFDAFCPAMQQLEREGAAAITTSCGFLVLLQDRLQAAARVPVVTSSLLLLPGLLERQRQVGVLTVSARYLQAEFFAAAGVPPSRMGDVIVEGVDAHGAFARAFLGNEPRMDFDRVRQDVVEAALRLRARAPYLTDLVLECTNMPPYAQRIREATGLRVVSLLDSPVLRSALAPG